MADENNNKNESVAAKFTGLPMSDLIAGPLTAVYDSQVKLAQA